MSDTMNFPATILDFIHSYTIYDTDQVYTNGSALIPVFRIIQALEHYAPELLYDKQTNT